MGLCSDTWIHGTAVPMGCEVRRLRLTKAGPVAAFGLCSSIPMAPRKPICCSPTRAASSSTNSGICTLTPIPRWIWSGATPSTSAACNYSGTRNPGSSRWRAAACATSSASIGYLGISCMFSTNLACKSLDVYACNLSSVREEGRKQTAVAISMI